MDNSNTPSDPATPGQGEPSPVPPDLRLLFLEFLEDNPESQGTVRDFSQKTGTNEHRAGEIAKRLWFEGLITRAGKKTGWVGRRDQEDPMVISLCLTPFAKDILNDPEGPEKWLAGQFRDPYRPQSRLEAAMGGAMRAPMTSLFLGVIATVFLLGLVLCSLGSIDSGINFLKPDESDPIVTSTLSLLGLETGADWEKGRWWRPLQAALVHLGFLHILMNGMGFWGLGRHVERVYGSFPYFLICLGAAWLGGCACLAWYPFGGAGASTALSGIIAADGVWFLLNRKLLSRRLQFLWRQQVMINLGLLIGISFMAKVSMSGHFGGAIGGALVGFAWLGFSNQRQLLVSRLLRTIGMLIAIGSGGYFLVENARIDWSIWDTYREVEYYQPLMDPLKDELLNPLFAMDSSEIQPLIRKHPSLRDRMAVDRLVVKLGDLEKISDGQKRIWEGFPRSNRQEKPLKILELYSAIDSYILEVKEYVDSGLRLDPATRERLEAQWERLVNETKPFFGLKEKPGPDQQK